MNKFESAPNFSPRAEAAFTRPIDVHVEDVPEMHITVQRVHEGLENGKYIPLRPEQDTPSQSADLKSAVNTFSEGEPDIYPLHVSGMSEKPRANQNTKLTAKQKIATGLVIAAAFGVLGKAGESDRQMAEDNANVPTQIEKSGR